MKKYTPIIVCLLLINFISGCVKELESPEKIVISSAGGGLPLIDSDIAFSDLKNPADSLLTIAVDEVGGYYVMNLGPKSFEFTELGSIINIAENDIALNNVGSFPIANGPQTLPTIDASIPIDLAQGDSVLSNATIRQIILSGGELELEMASSLSNTVNVSVTFTNIVDKTTNAALVLDYQLSVGLQVKKTQNLQNYKLVLAGSNKIDVRLAVSVNNAVTVPNAFGQLTLNFFGLKDLKWSRIDGKIGDLALPLGDDQLDVNGLGIRAFNSSDNSTGTGTVFFENPTMEIRFENYFGIPAKLILNPLVAYDKDSVLLSDRSNSPDNKPFSILKPTDPEVNLAGFPSKSTENVSEEILKDLLNKGPNYISFGIILSISGANTDYNSDFILSTSRIKTETILKLPLNGYLKDFRIKSILTAPDFSTLNTSSSGQNYSTSINKSVINFNFENKFPLDILAKLEFLDADSVAIPSLGTNVTINGANVDAQGSVQTAVTTKNRLALDRLQFEDLRNRCKSIRITGLFGTKGANDATPKSVKFYPTNKLNVKINFYGEGSGEFTFTD
ncbi:MAG: hypothetical protein ACKVOU_12835 [Cytophagales bacterium]